MKIILFSTDIDMIDEWRMRHNVENYVSCYDTASLHDELAQSQSSVIIADYDSVASEINKLISSNTLPDKFIVLEKAPEIATGKMLITHGVQAYGNSRMLSVHYKQMIQTVADGKIWTYPELTSAIVKTNTPTLLNEDSQNLINNKLTDKEREVVYLILQGLTNDAISNSLNITTRTVKAHISSIFSKLHVNDRITLVLLLK